MVQSVIQRVGDFENPKKVIKYRNGTCEWKNHKLMDFHVLLKCKRIPGKKQLDNDYLEPISKIKVKKQTTKAPHAEDILRICQHEL